MNHVYICQCLCPQRHCLLAVAGEYPSSDAAAEEMKSKLEKALGSGLVNPWCGLCGSKDLVFEVAKTKFKTMAEAEPMFRQSEQNQMETRAAILAAQKKAKEN